VIRQQSAASHWRIGKWLAFVVDGSRVSTPRSESNEQAFAAENFGLGGKAQFRSKGKNRTLPCFA
jgi:hypothetical protein